MIAEKKRQGHSFWADYFPLILVGVAVLLVCFIIGPQRYYQRILLLVVLWMCICSNFNIISGYGGQIVFGYMLFVGAGGYTSVLLFKFLAVNPWVGMFIGATVAAFLAFIIGYPTLRLHGHYFAVATVAFPLMAIPIVAQLGFEEVHIPFAGRGFESMQFTDARYYVLMGAILLVVFLIIVRMIERSRFGYALQALKQNEAAAEGMGIHTHRVKLLAFMLSAFLTGITGTVYCFSILFLLTTPAAFGLFIIVRILSITIVGGIGTLWGPVIGSVLLVPVGELLAAEVGDRWPGFQDLIYGIVLLIAIIYLPEGIWGKVMELVRRRKTLPSAKVQAMVAPSNRNSPSKQGKSSSFTFGTSLPAARGNEPPGSILRVQSVSKLFGGVRALQDVTIEVSRGKILGVIGPNGAGKTTLFNVMNGYLGPEQGKVFFKGKDVTYLKPHDLCQMGIGRTFQVPQIFNNMTILENVMIGAFARERNATRARAISEGIVQKMELTHRAEDQAVGLTILETKMLEFSRALATKPELILVDEPMAGLNPEESHHIGEIIKGIAESGITVIVIEHVVQSLVKFADYLVGLDEGRKVAEGTPEEVISNPHIIEAYLGEKWRRRYAKS
jgi:ABC-type branched-subunit amino acid transport system ATPase component/ABC-type branched-subunit amino acid transport system permease subunit